MSDDNSNDRGRSPTDQPDLMAERALDWARATGKSELLLQRLNRANNRRRYRRNTLATTFVAIVALALWRPWSERAVPAYPAGLVRSANVIRPETRTLPDGTRVELSPGSEIHVAFDGQVRRVELLRGTAHFDVAKDRQRPFLACAGSMRARAVGTAFAMEVGIMDLVVVVTEGRVAIEPASAPVVLETTPGESAQPGLLAALGPGDRARVTHAETMDGPGTPHVTSLSPQEIREALGWRVPRLEFSATPLSRVIEMFHEVDVGTLIPRIILDDPELGRLRLQGILRADDVDTLLLLLKSEFGVESHREPGVIRLRKAQD